MPCISCGQQDTQEILDYGLMPLVNQLPEQAGQEELFRLCLVECSACNLVQLTERVDPSKMFSDYPYFSSYSQTMLDHAAEIVASLRDAGNLEPDDLVVEIASNDGYLLRNYQHDPVRILGVEPAENVAAVAQEAGIPSWAEFFGSAVARRIVTEHGPAKVVHANNVLAHVPELNDFVAGIHNLLADDGLAIIEVPYLVDMVEKCEFDTVYHEHLCYFSIQSLQALLDRHGMTITKAERTLIHGGSLRIHVSKSNHTLEPGLEVMLHLEKETLDAKLPLFASRADALSAQLKSTLTNLKEDGKTVAGYAAAAKGVVFLNYAGIGPSLIDFVVDKNPHKQGRLMPGLGIPIVPPEVIAQKMPDYLVILAWNIYEEVIRQEQDYHSEGGRFIYLHEGEVQIV